MIKYNNYNVLNISKIFNNINRNKYKNEKERKMYFDLIKFNKSNKEITKKLLKCKNITYDEKIEILDHFEEYDLCRYFLQFAFKHIPLEERPNNKYWLFIFNHLNNYKYINNNDNNDNGNKLSLSYKPYALFKLCRDNAMPLKYKQIIYKKHREYFLNYVKFGDNEFTRMFMHFYPFLLKEDQDNIIKELLAQNDIRKYIIDFVNSNNVINHPCYKQYKNIEEIIESYQIILNLIS